MKTFLTLLTAIAPLSAHTLVGVRAKCAICPSSVGGKKFELVDKCTDRMGVTTSCEYRYEVEPRSCKWDAKGVIVSGSDHSCPHNVKLGNDNCHSTCY
ncbi:hypothetical protein BDN67DRAFT_970427 [Paxillus ammoniavirescens]|nr:hypothetical protein BDN67DRAFT_970427 [Paxillus ammoniavirescens]